MSGHSDSTRSRSSRHRVMRVALAASVVAGAALVAASSGAGASSKVVNLTVWNDPLAAGSQGVPASKSFLT